MAEFRVDSLKLIVSFKVESSELKDNVQCSMLNVQSNKANGQIPLCGLYIFIFIFGYASAFIFFSDL